MKLKDVTHSYMMCNNVFCVCYSLPYLKRTHDTSPHISKLDMALQDLPVRCPEGKKSLLLGITDHPLRIVYVPTHCAPSPPRSH